MWLSWPILNWYRTFNRARTHSFRTLTMHASVFLLSFPSTSSNSVTILYCIHFSVYFPLCSASPLKVLSLAGGDKQGHPGDVAMYGVRVWSFEQWARRAASHLQTGEGMNLLGAPPFHRLTNLKTKVAVPLHESHTYNALWSRYRVESLL